MRRGRIVRGAGAIVVAVLSLAVVPAALAAPHHSKNATVAQYKSPISTNVGSAGQAPSGQNGSGALGASASSGSLPFTGVQLTIFALVGVSLVGSGLLLRSTARERSSS